MNKLALFVVRLSLLVLLSGPSLFAHDGMEHVRGVVKATSAGSLTVQTNAQTRVVLSVTSQSIITKGGKRVTLKEVKVEDRVFIEVPVNTTIAAEIEIEESVKSDRSQ